MITKLCPKCRRVYIPQPVKLCPDCQAQQAEQLAESKKDRNRKYDMFSRDPQCTEFYRSAQWRSLQLYKINKDCVCEECGERPASMVHHIIPIKEDWSKRLDITNLRSLCAQCHYKMHH